MRNAHRGADWISALFSSRHGAPRARTHTADTRTDRCARNFHGGMGATGSHLAGHLVFAELAARTGNKRYAELTQRAAKFAVDHPMDNEMSDAVFMSRPLPPRRLANSQTYRIAHPKS